MRVLVVTRLWPTASSPQSGTFVADELKALARQGVEFTVLHSSGGSRFLPYARLAWAVRRRARSRQFDLVHAHHGTCGFCAVTQSDIPSVVTFHGSDLQGRRGPQGRRTLPGRIETAMARFAAKRASARIVVSHGLKRKLERLDSDVVSAGVDTQVFRPLPRADACQRLGLEREGPKRVLFVARPTDPVKRYSLAVDAVALLRSDGVDAELCPVHDRAHEEVALWMNACDALVLTSYSEGSPMVVKEALACGLPIVSVDVGDVAGRLNGWEGGRVVDSTPQALAAGLRQTLAAGPVSNARSWVDSLSTETAARRIFQIYERVLKLGPEEDG